MGLAVEDNESDSFEKLWTSDGDAIYLGASVKREAGGTQFAAIMSYGRGDSDVERRGQMPEPFLAEADRDHETLGGLLRVAHEFNKDGKAYLRPLFDLGMTYLSADRAIETGAGGPNLLIEDYEETYFWMRPALRFGYQHPFANAWKIQLHAGIGFHYYFSEEETQVVAGFAGAPAGVEPMDLLIELNQSYAFGGIGVDLLTSKDLSVGLYYNTITGDRFDQDMWGAIMKIPF